MLRNLLSATARTIAVLWLLLLGWPAFAAGNSCPPYTRPIDVNFKTDVPGTSYDNSLNITGIRNLIQSHGTPPAGPHTEALGVTFVTPAFGLEARTRIESHGSGYCVYLSQIDADFGFRSMDVYVASEYPPGTCEYNAVLDHENQHVAINTRDLKYAAPRVRAELERLLFLEQPVFTGDGQSATKERLAALSKAMDAMLSQFGETLAEDNGTIDTVGNYKAISDICRDWRRGNVWPPAKQSGDH